MGGLFSGDDCEQLVQRPVLLVANITSALLKKLFTSPILYTSHRPMRLCTVYLLKMTKLGQCIFEHTIFEYLNIH